MKLKALIIIINDNGCVIVVIVVLLVYFRDKQLWSCRDCRYCNRCCCCIILFTSAINNYGHVGRSVNLTILLLGRRLTSTQCTYIRTFWQLPFSNQWKGKNDRRKDSMINFLPVARTGIEHGTSYSSVKHSTDCSTRPFHKLQAFIYTEQNV